MDPAQEPTPRTEPEGTFAERAYFALPDAGQSAEERETPSGEYHRLTLEAIERSPDDPIPVRRSAPPPPVEDQLREALARLTAAVKRQPRRPEKRRQARQRRPLRLAPSPTWPAKRR